MAGLFGDDFNIMLDRPEAKSLVQKLNSIEGNSEEMTKVLKSKVISLEDRLSIITANVLQILGKHRADTLVIRDSTTFTDYINKGIQRGIISVDTETNNSLDPITAKLMGLCLYVPGEKQAYIPINHIDNTTGKRLENQLTEADCRAQLQRLIDANLFFIFHNYKFDYKVLKCTCNIEVPCDWDTFIAAKVIDENEISAGLKQQYIEKIDKSQQKYSIDHLFENILYEQVDPDIFALYAATDSMMTYKLYQWQLPIMESYQTENKDKNPYKLFLEVEMPCVRATAEMELNGILFDQVYSKRLHQKFDTELQSIDAAIAMELDKLAPKIKAWKLSKDANFKPLKKGSDGTITMSGITYKYEYINDDYTWYLMPGHTPLSTESIIRLGLHPNLVCGKSKLEQLSDPISMDSPTQLAILFYDIMGCKTVIKDQPRSTGEEALEKLNLPLTKLLLKRRGVAKLLDAFITSLPEKVNPKTGKIHCSFNQYGAKTGRFSSSEPNLQQIPSHEKSIRMLFCADCPEHEVDIVDNYYDIPETDEVYTDSGWKSVTDISCEDKLILEDSTAIISNIEVNNGIYRLYI